MTPDTIEQRIRNLEIRALAAERVAFMLAFYFALEVESGTPLTNLGSTLKTAGHTSLTDPDERKLFLEHTRHAAEVLSSFGDSVKAVFPDGGRKGPTKKQVETWILEALYPEETESS